MTKQHEEKKQENNKQEEELKQLKEEVDEWKEKYMRALADYQNLQKRVQEERVNWIQSANKELILQFLPVLDTLMLAAEHSSDRSIQVCINQFLDILRTEGVERISTEDAMFDPHVMEAVSVEDGEEGKVLEEVRAGFMLHDRLLRPAQVVVGGVQSKESDEEEERLLN